MGQERVEEGMTVTIVEGIEMIAMIVIEIVDIVEAVVMIVTEDHVEIGTDQKVEIDLIVEVEDHIVEIEDLPAKIADHIVGIAGDTNDGPVIIKKSNTKDVVFKRAV